MSAAAGPGMVRRGRRGVVRRRRPSRVVLLAVVVGVAGVLTAGGCTAGPAGGVPSVQVSADAAAADVTARALPVPDERATAPATRPEPATATEPDPATSSVPTTPTAPVPAPTSTGPVYRSTVSGITPEVAARMTSSWRPGCPVPLEDLRYVTVTRWDMSGAAVTGELVVHADVADGLVEVFRALFDAGYPIASMRLVDDFGGSDDASMAADNTSAFNCRAITGGTAWSEHAYGRAIDVNPVENPYVRSSGRAAPPAGQAFTDRHEAPGVIQPDDAVVRAFAAAGWQWGGYWDYPIDYQHFSTTGR